jgi:TetR/AcrR family transcriptional regulator, tetracycline repressor protein
MAAVAADGEGERSRLSKGTVVERAIKLADADGLDALTIRKLALDLGVTPMALYWHFRSKDDLLEALADRLWSEVVVTVDDDVPWPVQLRKGLESLLVVLRAHPSAPRLILENEKRSEAALRAIENALQILGKGGFGPQEAVEIARSTLFTAIMLVSSDPGCVPGLPAEDVAEHVRKDMIALSLLDPAKYPMIVKHAPLMASCDEPEFHYGFGVDLFIAGVEAMAKRSRPPQ